MKKFLLSILLLLPVVATAEVNIGTVTINGQEVTVDDDEGGRHNQCAPEGCTLYPMPRIIIDQRIEPDTQPNRVPGEENIVRPRH